MESVSKHNKINLKNQKLRKQINGEMLIYILKCNTA